MWSQKGLTSKLALHVNEGSIESAPGCFSSSGPRMLLEVAAADNWLEFELDCLASIFFPTFKTKFEKNNITRNRFNTEQNFCLPSPPFCALTKSETQLISIFHFSHVPKLGAQVKPSVLFYLGPCGQTTMSLY